MRSVTGVPARKLGYQPALDGLRGLAVAQVLLFHARLPGFVNGAVGVGVFFVLSGFLITYLIMSEVDKIGKFSLWNFYLRRIRRLLPAYVVVMTFCVVAALTTWNMQTLRGALVSMFYVSNWALALFPNKGLGMLHHTWTLSIEEQFYLVWPALLLGLSAYSRRVSRDAIVAGLNILLIVSIFCRISLEAPESTARGRLLETFGAYFMLTSGCLLALCLRRASAKAPPQPFSWRALMFEAVALLAIVSLAAVSALDPVSLPAGWREAIVRVAIIVASSTLIVVSLFSKGIASWLLTRALLVRMGMISYGLYLWHFPIFYLVDTYTGLGDIKNVLFAVIISIILASLSYTFIEKPFKRSGFGVLWPGLTRRQRRAPL
jgi:peptidoglycan/LPS O-acetylase OafA/YrhL